MVDMEACKVSISVVIVEDHPMVAAGLASVLQSAGVNVAGTAATVATGVAAVAAHAPDVVVVDQRLPDGLGTDLVRLLVEAGSPARALLVSAERETLLAGAALDAGALGCVSKTRDPADLVAAVRAVASGEAYLAPDTLARVLEKRRRGTTGDLTPREGLVLAQLAEGHSTREIAATLGVSLNTVGNHVQAVLAKLGAHTKLEAVIMAMRAGLVDAPRESMR